MCVIEQWEQVYQDGSIRWAEAVKTCRRCNRLGHCSRTQVLTMNPEYIGKRSPSPSEDDPDSLPGDLRKEIKKGKEKAANDTKAKEKGKPLEPLGLHFGSLFPKKKENVRIIDETKKKSESKPSQEGVRLDKVIPPSRPAPQTTQYPNPQPLDMPRPGPSGFYPNPGYGPQYPPQQEMPYRPMPSQPLPTRGPHVEEIRPKPIRVHRIAPQEARPEVIIPDTRGRGAKGGWREHNRRPSQGPASPRGSSKSRYPADGRVAIIQKAEADHAIEKLQTELRQLQAELQAQTRELAREQHLRQLTDREAHLRERLLEMQATEKARLAFIAGREERLIADERRGRPVIEQASGPPNRDRRKSLQLGDAFRPLRERTPPASPHDPDARPVRSPSVVRRYNGRSDYPAEEPRRTRSASRNRDRPTPTDRRNEARESRRNGPPVTMHGFDAVRREEEREAREARELNRRRGERRAQDWAKEI